MLVKFLSYTASVIGTARYKALFISCLILVFSFASIVGVALWQGGSNPNAANTQEQSDTENNAQQGSPQLRSGSKQTIANESPQPNETDQTAAGSPQNAPTAKSESQPVEQKTTKPADISLSLSKLTIEPGATSDQITASTTAQHTTLTWEVVVDTTLGLSMEQLTTTGSTTTFTISTKQTIDSSRSYDVLIKLKDTTQNTVLATKTIPVTILQ